jgi:zinc/manganese transport system permease protein
MAPRTEAADLSGAPGRRRLMFSQEFIRHALIAGSAVAIASGAIGYFVVLRTQVFAGDALSHVAFTGALAAALANVDLRVGLFAATIAIGLLFAVLGDRVRADDVAIGVVFVWVLGLGALLLDLFNRGAGGVNGVIASRTLFGSIFALTRGQTDVAVVVALGILGGIVTIARPLLFATIAPQVAATRGVPVGLLSAGFLALLGADAAEATQAVGALLLLGLLAAPAGAALRLTANPMWGLILSAAFALVSIWAGTTIAFLDSSLPPSSAIIGVAVAIYAFSFVGTTTSVRRLVAARAREHRPRP